MHADRASGSTPVAQAPDDWVDVTRHAAMHGFSCAVAITHEAWMDAVYFVDDLADRLDPVREHWRLGRALEEVSRAVSQHRATAGAMEFSLTLREGFDRLRSLSLPGASLHVRVEVERGLRVVRVDVERNTPPARRLDH